MSFVNDILSIKMTKKLKRDVYKKKNEINSATTLQVQLHPRLLLNIPREKSKDIENPCLA